MSTANPLFATDTLEYSPRAQGSGLADLVKATTTKAYLTGTSASEGRPKAEIGDNDSKDGIFNFSFEINNLTDEALTYTLDSSLLTESIYGDRFIAAAPYGLTTRVTFEGGNTVNVPANGRVTVNSEISLTDADKEYMNRFPNGIFVEGFVYAVPVSGSEAEQPVSFPRFRQTEAVRGGNLRMGHFRQRKRIGIQSLSRQDIHQQRTARHKPVHQNRQSRRCI